MQASWLRDQLNQRVAYFIQTTVLSLCRSLMWSCFPIVVHQALFELTLKLFSHSCQCEVMNLTHRNTFFSFLSCSLPFMKNWFCSSCYLSVSVSWCLLSTSSRQPHSHTNWFVWRGHLWETSQQTHHFATGSMFGIICGGTQGIHHISFYIHVGMRRHVPLLQDELLQHASWEVHEECD